MVDYSVEKLDRLKSIINKYCSKNVVYKPPTEVGGKSFVGFIPLDDGRIVRLNEDSSNDITPSPCFYDPKPIEKGKHLYTIPKTSKRVFVLPSDTPGPGEYAPASKSTKIIHTFVEGKGEKPKTPPMGGDLPPNQWAQFSEPKCPSNRFPRREFHPDTHTNQFLSKTDREIFNEITESPSPTKYTILSKEIEMMDEGTFIFKSKAERFVESKSVSPGPDAYKYQSGIGTTNAKTIVPPNDAIVEKMKKRREADTTPDPGQYSPEVVVTPGPLLPSPGFISRAQRGLPLAYDAPSPDSYTISRDINSGNICIRPKTKAKNREWDEIPQKETPAPGQYDTSKFKSSGGYISTIGHKPYEKALDHPLAFQTQHNSMLKKTHNIHYIKSISTLR